ncbi:MAG TPA: EI24 domain-containing protein [Brumimicrobium sp.]|nr:EI24 domain-containing protein [Brumimicrobium sp.]
MTALKDHYYAIIRAFTLLFKGHFLIFFIPGLVIAVLFYFYTLGLSSFNSTLGFFSKIPWIGSYIGTAIDTVFSWVNSFSIFIYQFTIITLLSPFHTVLSQRVDTLETGKEFPSNWSKFFNDILRTIGVVILGGLIYFFIYLLWTIFAWLFGLSFLSPFVSLLLIGFFTGFNSYDYSLERHDVSVGKSWIYAFSHPLQMTLTGILFTLLLYIPYLGVVIAPVLLTMVGTINYLRMEERKGIKKEKK